MKTLPVPTGSQSGKPWHPPNGVTPEMLAVLQHIVSEFAGGPVTGQALLPFQFPSLVHLDERMAAVIERARTVDGLSLKTIRAYRSAYRMFRAYLTSTHSERAFLDGQLQFQRRVLEGWIGWLRARGASHTTVNTYWRALHAPVARIAREDDVTDPTRFVPTPKPGKTLPRFLTRSALENVFRFVRNFQWGGGAFERVRNVALIAIMALGGCRLGEVLRLEIEDIDCGARTIRIKRGKGPHGGKPRVICMSPALTMAMTIYLDARSDRKLSTARAFVSIAHDLAIGEITVRRLCATVTKKTGIHVAPHLLRHTCATLMRQEGIADRLSMEQLGHTSLTVLQRYSHVAPGERQQAIAHFTFDLTGEGDSDLRQEPAAGMTSEPMPIAPDRSTPS